MICVMSGNFVQRGEAAVAPAHVRAEALLCGGADAVLELPYPYAAASAEFFAVAGVEILDRLGVDELWFGSECGDIRLLSRLAEAADSEDFIAHYAATTPGNSGTTEAYLNTLLSFAKCDIVLSSNDILGLAYLRAIRAHGSKMTAVTVRREGSAYREAQFTQHGYPSATALRRIWRDEGLPSVLPHLPAGAAKVYERACSAPPADLKFAERLILGHFRMTPTDELERIAELGGGLGNRMAECARAAKSLEDFLTLAATKKYPNARLQRGILFALTGIRADDLRTSPAYVRLLAANDVGCKFLAACRKTSTLPIVTRRADLPNTLDAQRQAERERRAFSLYSLCRPNVENEEALWTTGAIIKHGNSI